MPQPQRMFPCPKGFDIGKGAAEVFIMGTENLGGSTAMRLSSDRVFDRVHEGNRLTAIGQRHAVVPAFKKATIAAIPVIAAVRGLQATEIGLRLWRHGV